MTVATALAWARQREKLRTSVAYRPALVVGGAAVAIAIVYAFGLTDTLLPESWGF
jgi:uncharacterized membrane protein YedE/YeeE